MTPRTDTLTISFVGDICLGLNLRSVLRENGADWAFSHVKTILTESDLVVGNLECCLIDDTCPAEFKAQPMAVEAALATGLRRSGISVLNLANNHVLDCGARGLEAALGFLDSQGIAHFGAGMRLSQAEAARIVTHNGVRVAFLGACDVSKFYANKHTPGIAPYDIAGLADWFATKLSHLAHEGFRTLDRIGAWQLVLFNHPLWQRTLLEGVSLFPPASRIRLRAGHAPQTERYWEAAANPGQTGNSVRLLQELIDRMSHAHARAVPPGRKLACPVTGGLDSRMNLALHRARLSDGLLFHAYSRGSEEGPIAERIARVIDKPLLSITRAEGTLVLVEQDPDKETGELNMSQWLFHSTVASVALAAPDHILLDGYMQDVLFNPLIATAESEPATLAQALGSATYRYRMLGKDPSDRNLAGILELFRVEYALDRATCPLQASQRYYLENRSRRYVFGATRLAQNYLPVALAGIDSELLDFGFGLPWGLRHGAVLYRRAIAQIAPQLAAISYDKTGLPLTSTRKMALSLMLKRRLMENLEAFWPSRPFLRGDEASLGEVLRRHSRVLNSTHRVLAESSWVKAMLGGADPIDKLVETCGQRGRFNAILYPLLTLAKLDRLLLSDNFGSSRNSPGGKLM